MVRKWVQAVVGFVLVHLLFAAAVIDKAGAGWNGHGHK